MITAIAHHIPGYWWIYIIGFPVAALIAFYVVTMVITRPLTTLLDMIPWEVWFVLVMLVGGSLTLFYYRHEWISEGYAKALADIKSANDEANSYANAGQKSVDACYAAGGDWDRDLRVCDHPANK